MSRWYIIHAYSGFENKVKEAILAEADSDHGGPDRTIVSQRKGRGGGIDSEQRHV